MNIEVVILENVWMIVNGNMKNKMTKKKDKLNRVEELFA